MFKATFNRARVSSTLKETGCGRRAAAAVAAMGMTVAMLTAATSSANAAGAASVDQLVSRALGVVPQGAPLLAGGADPDVVTVEGASASLTNKTGTVTLTAAAAARSVVRTRPDGAQALTVLRKGDTARFTIRLPQGDSLRQMSNGGLILLGSKNRAVGMIDAPWAVDANGKRLLTSYSVIGDTIVQHVDTGTASYPIVADPNIAWYRSGAVVTLTRYDMYRLAAAGGAGGIWLDAVPDVGVVLARLAATVGVAAGLEIAENRCQWFWIPYWVVPAVAVNQLWALAYTSTGTYSC